MVKKSRKKRIRTFFKGILVLSMVIGVAGCPDIIPDDWVGSLVLTVNPVGSRSFTSNLDTDISEYQITLTHQGTGDAVSETFSAGQTIEVTDLPVGKWEVVASAANDEGEIVAEGSVTVDIAVREETQAEVTLEYLEGDGTFVLVVTWGNGILLNPAVTAELQEYNAAGTGEAVLQLDIELVDEDEDSSYEGAASRSTVAAGTYLLNVSVTDEDLDFETGQGPDIVIVRASDTAVTEAAYTIDVPSGSISIAITDPSPDSFDLGVIAGAQTAAINESVTFSADPGEADIQQYSWAINGVLVEENGEAEFLYSFTATGNYTITCLAEDINGVPASASVVVKIGDIFPSEDE
ncbi:MAG: hypothetical protein K9L21_03770 [Spirochaetia bacterium]|nr:hypothetical protein [Spirochaetia bacterium]